MRSLIRAPLRKAAPVRRTTEPRPKISQPGSTAHAGFRLADIPLFPPSPRASVAAPGRLSAPAVVQRRLDLRGAVAAGGTEGAGVPATRDGSRPHPYEASRRPNRTGLPDQLKARVEALSGLPLDDVRVHRNSPKPAQLRALAYARGTEIHLSAGQEHHLPHEAWHVVQQKQGRVAPTRPGGASAPINDDPRLEQEATRMGDAANALRAATPAPDHAVQASAAQPHPQASAAQPHTIVQMAPGKGRTRRRYRRKSRAKVQREFEYKRRQTAYGAFAPNGRTGLQGPHTEPHIMKRVIAKRAQMNNPSFDYLKFRNRKTALTPSAGQNRKLLRRYEEETGITLPMRLKKRYDALYKRRLGSLNRAKTSKQAAASFNSVNEYTVGTGYGHGTIASAAQLAGKGENAESVTPDVDELEDYTDKAAPPPKLKTRDPHAKVFDKKYEKKKARDYGSYVRGDDEMSEYDTSSDEEY